MMEKKFVFAIRPTADWPDDLPRTWWIRRALGPLAVLEASERGWRIIQPSVLGWIAEGVLGVGVALVVITGVFFTTALVIFDGQEPTFTTTLLWLIAAGSLSYGIMIPLALYLRKLVAWRPRGAFVSIVILSVNLGLVHQEFEIMGDGIVAHVKMTARRSTVQSALRFARQLQ